MKDAVPSGLGPGSHELHVMNGVGSDTADGTLNSMLFVQTVRPEHFDSVCPEFVVRQAHHVRPEPVEGRSLFDVAVGGAQGER